MRFVVLRRQEPGRQDARPLHPGSDHARFFLHDVLARRDRHRLRHEEGDDALLHLGARSRRSSPPRPSWKGADGEGLSNPRARRRSRFPMHPEEERTGRRSTWVCSCMATTIATGKIPSNATHRSSPACTAGPTAWACWCSATLALGRQRGRLPARPRRRALLRAGPGRRPGGAARPDHRHAARRDHDRQARRQALCKAKISVIAHSMGNFVVQKALAAASRSG